MSGTDLIDRQPYLRELLSYLEARPAPSANAIEHPDDSVNNLSEREKAKLRRAAVLIAITRPTKDRASDVVLTLRSPHLNSHAGQVSLPGGSIEQGDIDLCDTALRESEEEIGLPRSKVQVVGQLGNMALPSGFYITPVVGLIEQGLTLKPCPIEVAEIFHAPLSLLLNTDSYSSSSMKYKNRATRILEIQYGKFRIWGATAAMLFHLARELEDFRK
ncbi:MAG: hypothetical protein DHS20C12_29400 [Pseudohongiella sp.]|nr:MAG: hypothetical protein DHS20C12_29400 [Pseudohongiella sp.]